ncbi:MAG: hypothetical protein LBK73_16405 [Treponema sp.]|nr:hypothetical protein [Treponema sp.]
MAQKTDWFPSSRRGALEMAEKWEAVAGPNASAWNIPAASLAELGNRRQQADDALAAATSEETRTPVATARCKTAFEALEEYMRDFKRRYFLTPPLADADYVALGLKPHDATSTPSGTPTAQATLETYLIGRHELGVKIVYVTGSPHDPANKGYRIWHSVVAPGETPPTNPEQLTKSFFTKRKKDVIEFAYGDSGKTAHFAVQIENDGKKGSWGPLTSALIP